MRFSSERFFAASVATRLRRGCVPGGVLQECLELDKLRISADDVRASLSGRLLHSALPGFGVARLLDNTVSSERQQLSSPVG
jgi:hypothetical protein